jgi:hypothetical protein
MGSISQRQEQMTIGYIGYNRGVVQNDERNVAMSLQFLVLKPLLG